MLVMGRIRHAAIVPFPDNRSEPAKTERPKHPENRCRTTIAERMGETLAELPFTGNQVVCLGRDQAP